MGSEGDDPKDINPTTTRFKPMAREYFTLTNNNDVHRSTRNNPEGSQVYTLNGDDKAWGSDGPDVMWGGDGKDWLFGYGGIDLLRGFLGNDFMMGGDGDDRLYGHLGDDKLWGQNGNDSLICDPGNDKGYGGSGNDYIDGGYGNDYLSGMDDHDTLRGGHGADTFVVSNNQRNSTVRDLRDVGDKVVFQNISDPSSRFDGSDFVMMSGGEVVCTVDNLLDRIHAREARFLRGGEVGFEII